MSVDEVKTAAAAEEDKAKLAANAGEAPQGQKEAKVQASAETPEKPVETWWDTAKTIGLALAIALVVRSFLYQPFNIPSESMKPTLLVGDFLFVSKFAYGYSKNSLPFSLPLIPGRVIYSEPHRGDVVVFKTPSDNRTDYIKRVIGLPGDEIQVKGGVLYINGMPVKRRRLGEYTSTDPRTGNQTAGVEYEETLPNGVSYTTLDLRQTMADDTGVYHVPPGHFFMMGDNRDNSTDSRFPVSVGGVGYVPAVNLVGKAKILFFSIHAPRPAWEVWRWLGAVRYGRIFHAID